VAEHTFALPPQSVLRDEGDASGVQTTTVTVPASSPDAGVYVTASESVALAAAAAKKLLAPGVAVSITVDEGQIRRIAITRTV
jgi:hypothetical protein